ncbi:K+-transporting ATPase ATPase C chain [Herbaspirillum sp. Sphag1AN]|uniref:potassium-transporting ATPase subunit KdpC n=1 Tax=unclassified Herbaspirillum TaxID=2624150 RepID=UPI00160EA341|nr:MULTISPECIES: potassium-transporting ATPase subunit KdpC [unclassified Herbaspirillum]MBB3211415.1 K+-transporting ATPase ATPase C chain [Herbaspirillum sp. Sphag1AN]MBB3245318.1 K+-transporting ATPase ATPase C chain [Herbaspirillum sp. Sphag64]
MKTYLRPALSLFILMSVLLGLVYPAVVTLIGQAAFPQQANGSLIKRGDVVLGSELIGQNFTLPKYFWGRISAAGNFPYNGLASGGSNFGVLNPALGDAAKGRADALVEADPEHKKDIPVDLLTASASGLDPHISPAAAEYQVARIAKERGLSQDKVRSLVKAQTEGPQWGLFGESTVNVLKLNLALDAQAKS